MPHGQWLFGFQTLLPSAELMPRYWQIKNRLHFAWMGSYCSYCSCDGKQQQNTKNNFNMDLENFQTNKVVARVCCYLPLKFFLFGLLLMTYL